MQASNVPPESGQFETAVGRPEFPLIALFRFAGPLLFPAGAMVIRLIGLWMPLASWRACLPSPLPSPASGRERQMPLSPSPPPPGERVGVRGRRLQRLSRRLELNSWRVNSPPLGALPLWYWMPRYRRCLRRGSSFLQGRLQTSRRRRGLGAPGAGA